MSIQERIDATVGFIGGLSLFISANSIFDIVGDIFLTAILGFVGGFFGILAKRAANRLFPPKRDKNETGLD